MSEGALRRAVAKLRETAKINPKNLIATIYGDMLVPHGGTVWLGSLVQMTEPFGIAEYLARTTALRLAKDGWLNPTRVGKHSYYALTDEHVRTIAEYYPQIYGTPERPWNGVWRLILTGSAGLSVRAYTSVRKKLLWRGVGQISPHVFVSVEPELDGLESFLRELGLSDKVQILDARAAGPTKTDVTKAMVADAWNIAELEAGYEAFLQRFRPIWAQLERTPNVDPELGYVIRALLMTDYRRIALRDPRLPREFLPAVWAGEMAFGLCRNIYDRVLPASEAYLEANVRTAEGPIRAPSEALWARFGGLTRPRSAA